MRRNHEGRVTGRSVDGGTITGTRVEVPEPIEWVTFNDGSKVPADLHGGAGYDGVLIELDIHYADGEHTARKVTITADRPIRAADLRFPLSAIVERCVAVSTFEAHGGRMDIATAKQAAGGRRRRRQMTPEFLQEVADEWKRSDGDVVKVRERWWASRSQAYRWVELARKAGYIEEES